MAYIDNIRVNNSAVSDSDTTLVAGLSLVINWDYNSDPASPSQSRFELLIGTNESGWGSNTFVGDIVDLDTDGTASTYEHTDRNLSRGVLYYIQIRASDSDGNQTAWAKGIFQINQLPFVTNFFLTPSEPSTDDEIDVLYSYNDPDDADESGTKIRWFRNNIPEPSYNDLCTLPASATSVGDSWTARIIPSDGMEYGGVFETQAVVVENFVPSVGNINILPASPNVDDILQVQYEIDDNDVPQSGSVILEWVVNDVAISNSNSAYLRTSISAGDTVYALVKISDGVNILSQSSSPTVTILDSDWFVTDILVSRLSDVIGLVDLSPIVEWQVYKSQSSGRPNYMRLLVTKTPSLSAPIYDTGIVPYVKSSHVIPDGVLSRGQKYFIHVAVSDGEISSSQYVTKEIQMAGSSWSANVSNSTGWTVEFKCSVQNDNSDSNIGVYIHDGSYFSSLVIGLRTLKFISSSVVKYTLPTSAPDFSISRTFRISGRGTSAKVFVDNKLAIDAQGIMSDVSNLKFIEYGDIDGKQSNTGNFRFFRYSTTGAYGFGDNLTNENTYLFAPVGQIQNGSIDYVFDNLIAWLPDDTSESTKLIKFNENSQTVVLPLVSKNLSPITSIYIDDSRNKFVGTANGVVAIYGDKHDPDYSCSTASAISPTDFDKITTVPESRLSLVEPQRLPGWITLDTTYRSLEVDTPDPYDPYLTTSSGIHYYSQRTHGHAWFDRVDNETGWQAAFSFKLETLEADDFIDNESTKSGFGIYVNDGTRQEIIYFYEDRIRLFYANVFVPVDTTVARDYAIVGKGNNISVYQKIQGTATGNYQLLLNGNGLFATPSTRSGNSTKPRIVLDSKGDYHAVWQDDGNGRSQIFYSKYTDGFWSNPELVTSDTQFNLRNPDVDFDSRGRVWVAYEDTSWGVTEISVSVKDFAGWNKKTRITNSRSDKRKPSIRVDQYSNVHVVWEDNRDGIYQIFWAEWDNGKQAWFSSGQFGSDTGVAIDDNQDPYAAALEFRSPKLSVLGSRLWLVYEAIDTDNNASSIYLAFRDTTNKYWNSSGVPYVNPVSGQTSFGLSTLIASGQSYNPSISSCSSRSTLLIAWENQTLTTRQIYAAAYSSLGVAITTPTQITNSSSSSINPCVGFAADLGVIAFHRDNKIYLASYNAASQSFYSSATGGSDALVVLSEKSPNHPAIPYFSPTAFVRATYDYQRSRDPSRFETVEFPDHRWIGDATFNISAISESSAVSITENIDSGTITNFDSKEFAFGDLSSNVGLIGHWRDFSMYFGYDARPHTISKFNTNTVNKWPDDRVNDLFVDVFGNIIAATFGGLAYHNTTLGKLTIIDGHTSDFDATKKCSDTENAGKCLLYGKLTTSVKWGKNGIWYVGTTSGAFYTKTAGKTWLPLFEDQIGGKIINDIAVNKRGEAVIATASDGIFVVHPQFEKPIQIRTPNLSIRCVAVDEADIIWCGSDIGITRVENYSNFMSFGINQGMRSSHVNAIAIVNNHLRYIATATGIERMNGVRFANINVRTHAILNDNISTIQWSPSTNSLWVASLYQLHEIVFRDPAHNIVSDEVVHYDNSELGTFDTYDKRTYYILDFDKISIDPNDPISVTPQSTSVFVNKNKVDFGYIIDQSAQSVSFLTDMLPSDQIEVSISNKFIQYYDFNQLPIEVEVKGLLRRSIGKMQRTSRGQLILLSNLDKPSILLFSDNTVDLPFTTILLDRDLPVGCLQKLETLTRTKIRFKILAYDNLSGVDKYILSNYENFTSDGTNPLPYKPITDIVDHDIGDSINAVFDSLTIPTTATIGSQTVAIGKGSRLTSWLDTSSNSQSLLAGTSNPATVFKMDPVTGEWTCIQSLDSDSTRFISDMTTINNVIFILTGTTASGGFGAIYKSINGESFDVVGSVTGMAARGIVGATDGTVYIGSSDGKIYSYKNNALSIKYEGIGQSVYSLDIYNNILVVGTGNNGRIYTVNLDSDDSLIVFDGPDTVMNKVHIKDPITSGSPEKTFLFAGSSDTTTVYRSNMDTFDFSKSYNSFSANINQIKSVDTITLLEPGSSAEGTTTVASIGQNMFKHTSPSWSFFYKHPEEIKDFTQFRYNDIESLFIISESRITRWTAALASKTVFLKLMDKAGNVSSLPDTTVDCPTAETTICCNYAFAINIADLKNFVNENRIVDVSEYGDVLFSYDSPNAKVFYSAGQINQEIGIYTSEAFNGSNDLVSWKTIAWDSVEPDGTNISVQVRYASSQDGLEDAEWTDDLEQNSEGIASIEFITAQYLQFRVIFTSTVRDLSPSLSQVTIRNLTAEASHFFTTNFVLPSRPIKGLMTANTFIPVSADIVFGISANDSVDFSDYQIIEPDRLFTTVNAQSGSRIRIGAKLLSPGVPLIEDDDPYANNTFRCDIDFAYSNSGSSNLFHFRVRLFNDVFRTQLAHSFYTGNDQTGWTIGSGLTNVFPSSGENISNGQTKTIVFTPPSSVPQNVRYYVVIDAFDGSFFETIDDVSAYICAPCFLTNEAGLLAEYYRSGLPALNQVPNFTEITPDYVLIDDRIDYVVRTSGSWITTRGQMLSDFTSNFAVKWRGKLYAPLTGTYTFILASDDGSYLFIDNDQIIDNDGVHTYTSASNTIELDAGYHDIEVHYFNASSDYGIRLSWILPGQVQEAIIPNNRFFHAVVNEYCDDTSSPKLFNFGVLFEMENNDRIKINQQF